MAQRLIDELKRLIDDVLTGVHTSMPGVISSVDGVTASVKPSATFTTADGKNMAYPSLSGCPIVLPVSADGETGVAFPVSAGDACLIVCCESTLSQWQSGKLTKGIRFGLSNAVCIPCLLKAAPDAVSEAKAKNAAILFSKNNKVLVGDEEINVDYKDGDCTVKINDDGLKAAVKDTTKVNMKEQEITAEVGDEEHRIELRDSEARIKVGDSEAVIGKERCTLKLDDEKKIEVSNDSAGIYYDVSHYIEVSPEKTHVEGDLEISGSLIGG